MLLQDKINYELQKRGADFVHFVNISQLSHKETKGYPTAILFGMVLSPSFIRKVTEQPDYVKYIRSHHLLKEDEFHTKEILTDQLADFIANHITTKGYSAYSQSENNIQTSGFYDTNTKSTPLPHKTIAGLAGLGWIGKHNLLVTAKFGCAITMCTVLTNAPLLPVVHKTCVSKCGDCTVCVDVCPENAIKGNNWKPGISREQMVNVYACTTCLKCLALCPYTQKHMSQNNLPH